MGSDGAVTTLEEFESLEPEWDGLVMNMRRPSPFLLHGWLRAWIRHYLDDGELRVEVVRRDGRLAAALPLCARRYRGVRRLEFLGGAHSALADLLLAPDSDPAEAAGLARRLHGVPNGFADLFGLPGGSRLAEALGADARLRLIERVEAPVLDLPDGWEAAYRAKTTSKSRSNTKRRLRQLSEAGELEIRYARTPPEIAPALEDAFGVHELRWHGRPDGSEFATGRGRDFHREATHAAAAFGAARIVSLVLDGQPVSFHYYFLLGRRMVIYRHAFDPAFGRFSPGLLAVHESFSRAAEEGIDRVEFLGGTERYKMELAERLDPLYECIGLAGGPLGRLAASSRSATIAARRRLKQSEALHRAYLGGFGRRARSVSPD